MSLTGVGCRLQTCSRLASERFDSAFRAMTFIDIGPKIGNCDICCNQHYNVAISQGKNVLVTVIISSFL